MASGAAFLALLVLLPFICAEVHFQEDVFMGTFSSEGVYCYRVPSLIQVESGAILAFSEARKGSCNDQAPKYLAVRISVDSGRTWLPEQVAIGTRAAASALTYRNPYAVAIGGDNVLLNFVNSTNEAQWINMQMRSTDGGKTWSDATPVQLAHKWEGVLPGPGTAIQLDGHYKGRLVLCGATGYWKGHAMATVVWVSDNQGVQYNVTASFPSFSECQVAQLPNGTLYMTLRNPAHRSTCKCRAKTLSHDGGLTWTPVAYVPELPEPVCSAGLVTVGTQLLFSNPNSAVARVNMTVKSLDLQASGGRTRDRAGSTAAVAKWVPVAQLWHGPSAYSCMSSIASTGSHDRKDATPATLAAVIYERGVKSPYEKLTYALLSP